jgi:hypothetical protein
MPADETESGSSEQPGREQLSSRRLLTSAALIGAGMLVEPELLGGALLGAGVVYAFPVVGRLLRPLATTAVQLGYTAAASVGDLLASAQKEVEGIVATARSDYQRSRDL